MPYAHKGFASAARTASQLTSPLHDRHHIFSSNHFDAMKRCHSLSWVGMEGILASHDISQVKQLFPRGGSEMTAVHSGEEFTWKDYAPMAFSNRAFPVVLEQSTQVRKLCREDCTFEAHIAAGILHGPTLIAFQNQMAASKIVSTVAE
eukprot:scaffold68582_cov19-Tisochrysis_lutea.AAC.1